MRRQITESQAEKIADRRIMRALRRDLRYLHAENAEEQAAAEETITAEIMADMELEYAVYDNATYFGETSYV